jgi:hypothetical protein
MFLQSIIPVALSIPESVEALLKSALPGVSLIGIYGTNETGMLAMSDTCKHLGRLRPGIQLKVTHLLVGGSKGKNDFKNQSFCCILLIFLFFRS